MKRQSLFIVLLVLCLLTIGIGYYIFRVNVEVEQKTASTKDIEVIFSDAKTTERYGCNMANAIISKDHKRISIDVNNLEFNGAYASFLISVKNIGLLPAKLSSIEEYGVDGDDLVNVSYDGIGVTDEAINPGEERTFDINVKLVKDISNKKNNYSFLIEFNYVQG